MFAIQPAWVGSNTQADPRDYATYEVSIGSPGFSLPEPTLFKDDCRNNETRSSLLNVCTLYILYRPVSSLRSEGILTVKRTSHNFSWPMEEPKFETTFQVSLIGSAQEFSDEVHISDIAIENVTVTQGEMPVNTDENGNLRLLAGVPAVAVVDVSIRGIPKDADPRVELFVSFSNSEGRYAEPGYYFGRARSIGSSFRYSYSFTPLESVALATLSASLARSSIARDGYGNDLNGVNDLWKRKVKIGANTDPALEISALRIGQRFGTHNSARRIKS